MTNEDKANAILDRGECLTKERVHAMLDDVDFSSPEFQYFLIDLAADYAA